MPRDRADEVTTTTHRKPRYFYGWNIVAASCLANLSYAEQHSSMLGLFFKPLQNEFAWSRSVLAGVQTVARVIEAMIAPAVGPLIDRHGPRMLMPIGAIIVGFAMLGVTQIDNIWQFYLLRGIIVAIGFTFMGNLVTDVAINKWFTRKRGRAIAISRIGSSISTIIFVPIAVFVIAASGWRTMFIIFAVVTWLVVLIPSVVFMRRQPEDMGLHPDGILPNVAEPNRYQEGYSVSEATSVAEPIWSRRELVRTRSFWLLTASFALSSMAFQGINISLAPYIQDLNYGDTMLAAVMTFRSVITATTLLIMGFVAEYAYKVSVRVTPFVIQAAGAFLFLWAGQPVFLWLAVAVYGVGFSGAAVTQEVIWANYFGRLSLGRVRSLAFMVVYGFGAAGPLAMNVVFDIHGSYQPAFMVIIGLLVVAAFLMAIVQPPKAHRYARAAEMTPSPGQ